MGKPKKVNDLSERSLSLFKSLVEHFISDGQPVGSRALVDDMELSAATIRNVMADLEELGLLSSPYVSSGRVPTSQGYRLFVDSLLRVNDLDNDDMSLIAGEMISVDDKNALLVKTSTILSDITRLASVVTLPRPQQNILNHIEFIALSDKRILVILVMNNNEVQNRIIHTAKPFTISELEQANNYLNQVLLGKSISDIHVEMLLELENMKHDFSKLMHSVVEMAKQAIDLEMREDYVLTGETNLMNFSEWDNIEQLKRLFDAFNEKRSILHLLEQSINAKGVQLFIGEESGYEVLDDCSIVISPYNSGGQTLGVLGVIGPRRMHYERVIPIVDLTAKMLGSALNSM